MVQGSVAPLNDRESDQPVKSVNKLWGVCMFILVVEACERLCFYTLQASMRPFIQKTGFPNKNATSITGCFSTLVYGFCFLGGYIADNVTGKFYCILYLGMLYVVGVWLIAIAALPQLTSFALFFIGAFIFVSIGGGMIKPNVMNFGAEQYDESIEEERKQQESFFSYFYVTINIGAFVGFGFVGGIATRNGGVSCEGTCWGFFNSYLIAALAMTCAFAVYLSGASRYQAKEKPEHKPMFRILVGCIVWSPLCVQKACAIVGWILMPSCLPVLILGSLFKALSVTLGWISFGMALSSVVLLCLAHTRNQWIQGYSDMPSGPSIIDLADVRQFFAVVPIMLTVSNGFGVAYNSMNAVYPSQACFMAHPDWVNGQMTSCADSIAIIALSPLLESYVFPMVEARQGKPVSSHTKFIFGFVFVIFAQFSAAIIEYVRAGRPFTDTSSNCSAKGVYMSDMSFLWMSIPMALTGIGEILVNPVSYAFVYEKTPAKLRALAQGVNLAASGALSSAITTSYTNIMVPSNYNYWTTSAVDGWTTPDGNAKTHSPLCLDGVCGRRGQVQYYFYTSAGIAVLCLISYFAVWYCGDARHIRENNQVTPA